MGESINYGISGVENLTAENIAVGPGSKVEQTDSLRSLEPALELLRRAIECFEAPPRIREELTAAQSEITAELQASAPEKRRILSRLALISGVAGSAGALGQAATGLAQLVGAIL
jgi:hypothetical protein